MKRIVSILLSISHYFQNENSTTMNIIIIFFLFAYMKTCSTRLESDEWLITGGAMPLFNTRVCCCSIFQAKSSAKALPRQEA